jgi:hypothetical protein
LFLDFSPLHWKGHEVRLQPILITKGVLRGSPKISVVIPEIVSDVAPLVHPGKLSNLNVQRDGMEPPRA